MRGKVRYKRQPVVSDPKFKSEVVAKFVNYLMRKGKKSKAQNIVYKSFALIEKRTKKKSLDIFEKALKNVGPYLEVKSRRIGGANYQVPMEVPRKRRLSLAMRWILDIARNKKGKSMYEKLAEEMILASQNRGDAVRKKEETHKMAEANRAFAHFAKY